MEVDLYRNLLPQVTLHTARMYLEETTPEGEAQMLDEFLMPAVRDIATAKPDLVVFGCTSAGALRGYSYDCELRARISEITGVPTISTVASVQECLARLGVRNLAVITPYVDALNERIKASLETENVDVVALHGLGITENFKIAEVSPESIHDFTIEKVAAISKECVFLSCTNMRALDAVPQITQELGVPVISSNQAVLEVINRFLLSHSDRRSCSGNGGEAALTIR